MIRRVEDADFEAAHTALLSALDEADGLLGPVGEEHWRSWLANDRSRIANGDRHALDHLLQAFGGMGSFNDLVIHPVNGNHIDDADVPAVNRRLGDLRNNIWTAAKAMKRYLDSSS